ncbi:MAG: AAA family ATPase, partial [Pseudorhodobacter sp.]|nr:AAA family ATPase [Frankiaceae bacterium]
MREVEGVPRGVRAAFSARRASIESAYADLVSAYRTRYGHEPAKGVQFAFSQQATLDTRGPKEEPVTGAVRRAQWRTQAASVLGSEQGVDDMVAVALHPAPLTPTDPTADAPEVATLDLVSEVLGNLAGARSVWTVGNVAAEAQRVARTHGTSVAGRDVVGLADDLTRQVLARSVALAPPDANPVPASLARADGESVYLVHAAARFTSVSVLEAEDRLVRAARQPAGLAVGGAHLAAALAQVEDATGRVLGQGQVGLAARFAAGGHLLEAGIGPAGAGKTTAMAVVARAVELAGGRVLGLAPSAAAASVLASELGIGADTVHKILHAYDSGDQVPERLVVDDRTVILVDEAGIAATPELDRLVALAADRLAVVRLPGDPAQLQAVGAGGVLRLIDAQVGAAHLEHVHRFATDGEPKASLRVREGHPDGLSFYIDAARTTGGTGEAMADDLYAAWWNDTTAGKASAMIAGTSAEVTRLSMRARLDRVATGDVEPGGVPPHDDGVAGVGDTIVTRRNARLLKVERGTDFVKNGDLWTVVDRHPDGSLRVRGATHRGFVTLPTTYVAEDVELGYAATIHRVQGMTVDTAHYLVAAGATREQLDTRVTRGRESNRLYVVIDELLGAEPYEQPTGARAVRQSLEVVLGRAQTTPSATATLNDEYDLAGSLARLVPAYEDAHARVLDPGRDQRLAGAVVDALGTDLAATVTGDDAWPALRERLARHEAAGVDIAGLVRERTAARELGSAASLAAVLHHRIGTPEPVPVTSGSDLPGWITPAPDVATRPGVDPAARDWVTVQAALITARLDALVDDAATHQPDWTAAVTQIPGDPLEAEQWRAAVRRIAAYRDRYDIDSAVPVSATGSRGGQETARADARAAYASIRDDNPDTQGSGDDEGATRGGQRVVTATRVDDVLRRTRHLTGSDQSETLTERVRRLREQPTPGPRPDKPTPG